MFSMSIQERVGSITHNNKEKCVQWRIENFFSPPKDNCVYYSPDFVYFRGSWCLEINPKGKTKTSLGSKTSSEGYITAHLFRYSRTPPISVRYSLALKTVHGITIKERDFLHVFSRSEWSKGVAFCKRSDLEAKRATLIPTDVLFIICRFKYIRFNDAESEGCTCVPSTSKDAVLSDFKELFRSQEDCDITLKVNGGEILAHKAVLRARAPALLSKLRIDKRRRAPAILDVKDIKHSCAKEFLGFLYCGKVEGLSNENVFDLYDAAVAYDVLDLREECLLFVSANMCLDTFFDVVDIAERTPDHNLDRLVSEFFSRNAEKIIVTDQWAIYQIQNPKRTSELFLSALAFAKSLSI